MYVDSVEMVENEEENHASFGLCVDIIIEL